MATINLAPGNEYLTVIRRRRLILFSVSGVLLTILVIAWLVIGGLVRSATSEVAAAEQDLSAIETEVAQLGAEADRIVAFEQRLVALDELLDTHITWAPLFDALQALLPPPTVITRITANAADGTINFEGTTPDIDTVAQTVANLENQPDHETIFTTATVENIGRKEEPQPDSEEVVVVYTFNGTLQVEPSTLRANQSALVAN